MMESLPFQNSAYEGFGVIEGRIRLNGRSLLIEFHVKDSVFGAFKSDLKTISIPLEKLEAIRYKKARFGRPSIELDVTDASLLNEIPGASVGTLILKLLRSARPHAEAVVRKIEFRLAEQRLQDDSRDLSERDVDYLFGSEG
jgi:hypothetical protein